MNSEECVGFLNESAFSGLEVYSIERGIDDVVKFKTYRPSEGGTLFSKMITSKIRYVEEDGQLEPYFMTRRQRVYLREVLRSEYV